MGAAKGDFLIDCAKKEITSSGIEYYADKVDTARMRAREAGVSIDIVESDAEAMPYPDASFGFANLSEIIEHVKNPEKLMQEVFRVLAPGGVAYVSVPSRFSWYDTHFHVPFVNWLPRAWSDAYIALVGKHKMYEPDAQTNMQRLSEMHYYTFSDAVRFFKTVGFSSQDLRVIKIRRKFKNPIIRYGALSLYYMLRPWYFRAFHFLLTKAA